MRSHEKSNVLVWRAKVSIAPTATVKQQKKRKEKTRVAQHILHITKYTMILIRAFNHKWNANMRYAWNNLRGFELPLAI